MEVDFQKLTKINFDQKKVNFDLAKKSTVNNRNLGSDNDIRVRTIIKQAVIDTQLKMLL